MPIRAFYFPLYSFKTYVIFRKGLRLVLSNIKDRKTNTQNASRDKSYEKKIQEVGEFFFLIKENLEEPVIACLKFQKDAPEEQGISLILCD